MHCITVLLFCWIFDNIYIYNHVVSKDTESDLLMKLKYLLPAVAIAPVSASLVSCAAAKVKLDVDKPIKIMGDEDNALESKKITFNTKDSYTLNIKWDDCLAIDMDDGSDSWTIGVGEPLVEEGKGFSSPVYNSVKIWVNEKEMSKTNDPLDTEHDYLCGEGCIANPQREWGLKAGDIIKVQFKLKTVPSKYKTTTAKIISMK